MSFIVAYLDVFNYSYHSERVSCWNKRLLAYLLLQLRRCSTQYNRNFWLFASNRGLTI